MITMFSRRDFMKLSTLATTAGLAGIGRADGVGADKKAVWPFYTFANALSGIPAPEDKCRLLKELGFDGTECYLDPIGLPRMLEQLDKHGLKLFAIYTGPWLEDPVPSQWREWIALLKGRETRIEVPIHSRVLKPSDPAGDPQGQALIKCVSDLCDDTGPVVSIYPHADFWTERVDDGIRLARQVRRKNVGVNFNLKHWHWVRQPRPLMTVLQEAMPHLFLVTLNGLRGPSNGSLPKVRSLDDNDYDLRGLLATIKKLGYAGPVGLQCFGITEPPAVHLRRSINAWRTLTAEL